MSAAAAAQIADGLTEALAVVRGDAEPYRVHSQPADRLAVDAGSDGSTAADASIAIIPEPVVLFPADPLRSGATKGDEAELPAQETNVKHDGPTHSGEVA